MQNLSKKWHVVYTKPKSEKKVASLLAKKKIECYFPVNTILKDEDGENQNMSAPLFQSMVFVYVDAMEQLEVCRTNGVINFMYWLNKPAVIRDEEVEEIRQVMNEFSGVRIEKMQVNQQGEMKVSVSTLTIREGNIMEVSPSKVNVSLPSLGYTLEAAVKRNAPETINNLGRFSIYTRIKQSLLS